MPMDRDEAIAWLRSVGRNASARDWVLGKTIVITVGEASKLGGIEVYPSAVYLYPTDSGGWNLYDLEQPDPAAAFEDLESAARAAHEYIGRLERALTERQ